MRRAIIALLSTTFVLLPISNGFAQDFSLQLQEALKAKDWNQASEIVDKMIQANPQQAQELMEYRAQLNKRLPWRNAQLLRTLKARGAVYAVALSRDGKTLVSGGDKTLEIWNLKTGESRFLSNWMIPNEFKEFPYIVKAIEISSDGKYIQTTIKGKNSTTPRSDCTSSSGNQEANSRCTSQISVQHNFSTGEDEIISKDASSITKYSSSEIAKQLWNLETGEQVDSRSIKISDAGSNLTISNLYNGSLVVHPDMQVVASVSDDGNIKLADMQNGQLLNTLTGSTVVKKAEQSTVTFMAFSSDGKTLIRADVDGTIEVWTTQ